MADARGEDAWSFRSVVVAELYNMTRSREDRHGRAFEAREFNPYADDSTIAAEAIDGELSADELAIVFGHGLQPTRQIMRPKQMTPAKQAATPGKEPAE